MIILYLIARHRNYSQLQYRKALACLTVLHPTLPSCTTCMSHLRVLATVFSMAWHKIVLKDCVNTKKIQVICGLLYGKSITSQVCQKHYITSIS